MTASYQLVDYSLRPAKFAERKMMCEMFSRLKSFASLDSYRYLGFGSIWFADCVLFHRLLGINDIVSVEREIDHEPRFEFNRPYRSIILEMKEAADLLPSLDWMQRSIVWLDYDDPLNPSILDDIHTCAARMMGGSVLAISVQAEAIFDSRDIHDEPLRISNSTEFKDYFGSERTPEEMTPADLRGWTLSKTSRKVIHSEITDALTIANQGRPNGAKLRFQQIGAFEYADGAKMTTVVGVFVDPGQVGHFGQCRFDNMPFYRDGADAFRIKVPKLTPREMRHLDRSLPSEGQEIDCGPIPKSDANKYSSLYRYLPNFASFEP